MGELKQLASDGEISAQVLIEALRRTAEQGGDALADFFKTPAGQLKLFDKANSRFSSHYWSAVAACLYANC